MAGKFVGVNEEREKPFSDIQIVRLWIINMVICLSLRRKRIDRFLCHVEVQ